MAAEKRIIHWVIVVGNPQVDGLDRLSSLNRLIKPSSSFAHLCRSTTPLRAGQLWNTVRTVRCMEIIMDKRTLYVVPRERCACMKRRRDLPGRQRPNTIVPRSVAMEFFYWLSDAIRSGRRS